MTAAATPPTPGPEHWAPALVQALGRPGFHARLLQALRATLGADHLSHLVFEADGRLCSAQAASLSDQPLLDATTAAYRAGLYRRDPNYPLVCRQAGAATAPLPPPRVLALAPERIRDAEYRRRLFDEPGFGGKLALIGGDGSAGRGRIAYLNLYFGRAPAAGAAHQLQRHGALLLALAERHTELAEHPAARERLDAQGSDDPAPSPLSERERQVAQLLRQGLSTKEVARALQLSPATVVTYKTRLFEKLGLPNLKALLRAPAVLVERP